MCCSLTASCQRPGRSLLTKFLVQDVYYDEHIDESYHRDAATIGTVCFLEHRMQSFRCCL